MSHSHYTKIFNAHYSKMSHAHHSKIFHAHYSKMFYSHYSSRCSIFTPHSQMSHAHYLRKYLMLITQKKCLMLISQEIVSCSLLEKMFHAHSSKMSHAHS